MPIGGRRYIDGGVWGSGDNAHLAANASSVLVISPIAGHRVQRVAGIAVLDSDLRSLRAQGSRVHLIVADEASLATRSGGIAPDPGSQKAAAEAGRLQGRGEVSSLLSAFS